MTILSFGEIIWDVYPDKQTLGGAPLNLASHASLQGCEAWMISAVGNDALGGKAIEQIEALGVKTAGIGTVDRQTGACIVTLDKNGVPKYDVLQDVAYDYIPISPSLPKRCDVLAFGTLALRGEHNRAALKKIIDEINSSEIFTDINIRPPFYSDESIIFCLESSTIVKISDEELPIVMSAVSDQKFDCESASLFLADRFPNLKLILITKGKNGSLCYDTQEKTFIYEPAAPAKVVSTVGAGDSFGATFLAHYMKTGNIAASLALASRVSAFVVSRAGAIPDDIRVFLSEMI